MVSEEASHGGCAQGVPGVARVSQCLGKNIQAQTSPGTQQGPELVGSGTDKNPRQAKTGRGSLFPYSHPHQGTCHKFLALPPGCPAAPSLLISKGASGAREPAKPSPGGAQHSPIRSFIHPLITLSDTQTPSLSLSPSRMVKGLYLAAWEASPASHALSPRCTQEPSKRRWCAEGWHPPPPITFLLSIEAI